MTEVKRALSCLGASPETFASFVSLVDPEKLLWKPADGRWSICEVLRHLTDVENRNLGLRAKRILEEELPELVDYDPALRYEEGAYPNDDGSLALDEFVRTRRETLAWLSEIDEADASRKGLHPAVGEVELRQILGLWAFHDLSHLRQVAEIVKAVSFWDGIGSLQRYYRVNP